MLQFCLTKKGKFQFQQTTLVQQKSLNLVGTCFRVQVLSAGVDCEAFRPYEGEDLSTIKQALHQGGIEDVSRPTVLAAARLHHSKRLPAIVAWFSDFGKRIACKNIWQPVDTPVELLISL